MEKPRFSFSKNILTVSLFFLAVVGILLTFAISDYLIHFGFPHSFMSRAFLFMVFLIFGISFLLYLPLSLFGYRLWKGRRWGYWGATVAAPFLFAYAASSVYSALNDLSFISCGLSPHRMTAMMMQSNYTVEVTDDFLRGDEIYYSLVSSPRLSGKVGNNGDAALGLDLCQARQTMTWRNVSSSTLTLEDLPSSPTITLARGESHTETFREPTIETFTLNGYPKIIHVDAFFDDRPHRVDLPALETFCKRFAKREVKFGIVDSVTDDILKSLLDEAGLELVQEELPYFVIARMKEDHSYEDAKKSLSGREDVFDIEPDCLLDDQWKDGVI